MATATITRTAPVDTTTSDLLALLAGQETPEFAPGRVGGRQASFDAVAAWSASGSID